MRGLTTRCTAFGISAPPSHVPAVVWYGKASGETMRHSEASAWVILLASQAGAALRAYLDRFVRPCSFCGCLARCQLCAKCRRVRYCGRACQSRDWAGHKAACHA
jgi:hypothetical protein